METALGVMLLALVFLLTRYGSLMVSGQAAAIGRERPSVVIDVGHGGNDPGKVGVDKSLEKDINLQIAFYYSRSEKGKELAEILQERFDYVLGEKNTRQAKANDSYYMLLHVKQPIVIVECGFLSNWDEAARLNTPEYQDRLAWTIHMGVMEYLNGR